jgi:ABC-type transport system involved in multi-copper enzyme maturation permease subunit
MILFFLFLMRIDVVEGAVATISLFGETERSIRDLNRFVRNIQAAISTFLYSWGMVLAVFASSGLIPSVLEPGRIELLVSKPVSRAHILLGRYLGNILVVACNIAYLVLGVWIIFGVKTGIWDASFLVAIVLGIAMFAVLLSIVVLTGVLFESAAVSTMVTVALMIMSPILAQQSTMERLLSSEWSRNVWRALHAGVPKVYEVGRMTVDFVNDRRVESFAPLWSSFAFAAVILGTGLFVFTKRDF